MSAKGDQIRAGLHDFDLTAGEKAIEELVLFSELILKFNSSLNLISKTNPEQEVDRQIIDSTALLKFYEINDPQTFLDIGSGAGIPGIVLKILRPQVRLLSLDSSPKKITFQMEVGRQLKLDNCEYIDLPMKEYKPSEKIDMITAKAFGKFEKLLGYTSAVLDQGKKLVLYLGEQMPKELGNLRNHGFLIEQQNMYSLPGYPGNFQIVILQKAK